MKLIIEAGLYLLQSDNNPTNTSKQKEALTEEENMTGSKGNKAFR